MLKTLTLKNVGPASEMHLDFGSRLNILTGDNGLGKSFLLDIIWWSLTRTWPAEVNSSLTSGKKALPHPKKTGSIASIFSSKNKEEHKLTSKFLPWVQQWEVNPGRPPIPGLVFYAMSDGSFAAWDPARNYWKNQENVHRPPAYVFSPTEVWDGLKSNDEKWLCNGIIRDWTIWQKENRAQYKNWRFLLEHFSPSTFEIFSPGNLTRIDLDDVRDMPTLRMPYGQDVPIVHASSGVRRIIALAYFLLWGWKEHLLASKLIRSPQSDQVIFLVDEIESHLHPSWQRVIVPAILSVMDRLHKTANVQLITATHSPLTMSSIEPGFNPETDAWFDIDFKKKEKKVVLRKCDFENLGESDAWLTSDAFDLDSTRAPAYQNLIDQASELFSKKNRTKKEMGEMTNQLVQALNPKDPFLIRWNFFCVKEGLIK